MGIRVFGYDFCPLELITDSQTGKLSASKLWLHVGNTILSMVMLRQQTVGWELFLAYGAVVGGNYVAIHWLKWKYRSTGDKNDMDMGNTPAG
jgi:hypothetical protein